MMVGAQWSLAASAGVALAVGLTACGKREPPTPQIGPVEVTAVTITPRDIPAVFEFVGQTESSRQVEIRARVEGFLEKRVYTEGTIVKAGAVLFQMDRKPFEAQLAAARAEVAQQQARLETARANLVRIKPLAAQNAVSQKDLDEATGGEQTAAAAVEAARAKVEQARLDLSYTTIVSPVHGLSSFAKQQEGTFVSAQNSLLTYVAALDPMWVNFSISENQRLRYGDSVRNGTLRPPPGENYVVEIVLADGTVFPSKGRITFSDAAFSQQTGTFPVRATLANHESLLHPGQFVRVRVQGGTRPGAVVIPQRAVLQGAKGHFVWVVDQQSLAEMRPVHVGEWYEEDWIINAGLKPGERVAVDGAIKLRPQAPVKIVQPGPAPRAAAGAPTAGTAPVKAAKQLRRR